ncbi:hypothetical protein HYC85_030269 [Camellia sinensis]|uniref:Uncharacterized protein n=1 Tax=Camellia sinensis TaxID=4442 RepID=A0A7J7G3B1_CAMSI|nr:hypothetical protein HYC85_030269 [Camellia sinensis]
MRSYCRPPAGQRWASVGQQCKGAGHQCGTAGHWCAVTRAVQNTAQSAKTAPIRIYSHRSNR